jgi:hypothetical protein
LPTPPAPTTYATPPPPQPPSLLSAAAEILSKSFPFGNFISYRLERKFFYFFLKNSVVCSSFPLTSPFPWLLATRALCEHPDDDSENVTEKCACTYIKKKTNPRRKYSGQKETQTERDKN